MIRVLVIDDEVIIAEMCAMALRTGGFEVSVAPDAETGLQLIHASPPDVVVSDIRMPGMQGDELASVLKADPATAHLPVLLMSGHSHAGGESCDAFLAKPFVVADLLATVRRLARRGADDQSR